MNFMLSPLLYMWRLHVSIDGRIVRPPLQHDEGVLLLALEQLIHPAAGLCINQGMKNVLTDP